MVAKLTTISDSDFGGGIDSQSPPNRIQAGYLESALNADPKPTGPIAKRKGYQGYAGNIPVRVQQIESAGTSLTFLLDTAIDLSGVCSTPIIVMGRSSNSTGGDILTTDSSHYYSSFVSTIRTSIPAGTNTISIPNSTHALDTPYIWAQLNQSTSFDNNSGSVFYPDKVRIDKATYEISLDITNSTGSAFDSFIYYADRQTDAPTTFAGSTATANSVESILTGTNTYTIPFAVHQLSSNQILVKVFSDSGTEYEEITPDAVTINKSTKQVQIELTNGTGSAFDAFFALSVAPAVNYKTGAVATGSTNTVILPMNSNPFNLVSCYIDNGTTMVQVIPDSIVSDAVNDEIEVTFTDSGAGGANFSIFWQAIELTTNKLTVTQGSSATYTDSEPQLTLYGFDHSEIYHTGTYPGWATYIDSYRSVGDSRLITGLGGNLFAARAQEESSDYLMPTLYPNLESQIASDTVLGPAIWDDGDTPNRTRGYITSTAGASNTLTINSVEYDSGLDLVKYTLDAPGIVVTGTPISTGTIKDRLTVSGTSYRVHNGEFPIHQVTYNASTIEIWVLNTDVDSSDYDILGAGGDAGVFTDQITLSSTNPFILSDRILSDLFSEDSIDLVAYQSNALVVGVTGAVSLLSIPTGLKLVGRRTTSVIPVREFDGTASVDNLVRGDMISLTGIDRLLRIKTVNALSDISITIAAGDGETALVTLGSGDTTSICTGSSYLIRGGSTYSGAFEVSSIISSTEFEIISSYTDSDMATLVGKTIEIDESLLVSDSTISANEITVPERWISIEAPDDSFSLTQNTRVSYFDTNDYTSQPILRSTMVNDSLYLTNGDDEIMKFDGTNLYRAGLPRFQSGLFLETDTTTTGKIDISSPSINTSAHSQSRVTLTTTADKSIFEIGAAVQYSVDGLNYIIQDIQEISGTAYIYLDRPITAATAAGTLAKLVRFKYYLRLNAVDANNNLVASAAVSSNDLVAELAADAGVRLRMSGLPVLDNYDYDRLEVQIYRTKADTSAPYYRITTIPLEFDNAAGYFDYLDSTSDDELGDNDLDAIATATSGASIGSSWSQPLRAKSITSAANRLILANLKDYPTLDMQILKASAPILDSAYSGLSWTIRKSNLDAGTANNLTDRMVLQWRPTSAAVSITSISATASNFTVTSAGHGMLADDWVYIYRDAAGNFDLKFSGWFKIASAATNTFTITYASDGILPSTYANKFIYGTTRTWIPVLIGTDGNYGMLNGNSFGATEFRAMRRLADAINSAQRTISTPWVIANAGNDYNSGQLVLKQAKTSDTTIEVKLPAFPSSMEVYVNETKRAQNEEVSAISKIFPSRLIASYPNFPEIFQAPTTLNDFDSASAIDINPADGQEITAIIPFFGDSAFGAALQSGVVVVFKTNSIYLVDLAAKAAGANAVQKIESQGKGCTAPYSVSTTKDGIIFANEAGIYRLNRNLSIDYVGRKYEGEYKSEVNKTYLALASGHHDNLENKYKLSYVSSGASSPDLVAVYNHTREYENQTGLGSWSTYDNHPALGWANFNSDAFFASTLGRIFSKRQSGSESDFRDDSSSINFEVVTRANDFGDAGIRKFVRFITMHYLGLNSVGTSLQVATNLIDNFEATDIMEIKARASNTGLDNTGDYKVNTIQSSVDNTKGIYFQLKVINNTIDEAVEIVGLDWRVAGLTDAGVPQAKKTTA